MKKIAWLLSLILCIATLMICPPAQAAQDVREKVALIKSAFRKEVKEPRVTRFDPADRPIFSVAVTNDAEKSRYSIRELPRSRINWLKNVWKMYVALDLFLWWVELNVKFRFTLNQLRCKH